MVVGFWNNKDCKYPKFLQDTLPKKKPNCTIITLSKVPSLTKYVMTQIYLPMEEQHLWKFSSKTKILSSVPAEQLINFYKDKYFGSGPIFKMGNFQIKVLWNR